MKALILILALCSPSEWEFAWQFAQVEPAAEQSVVKESAPKPAKVEETFRTETRYRTVRKKFCNGRSCSYRWVKEAYTVKVPTRTTAKRTITWPNYPTSPRQQPWTQGGRHITWRHLTQGEHHGKFDPDWLQSLSQVEIEQLHADDHENKVKWAYVVRP